MPHKDLTAFKKYHTDYRRYRRSIAKRTYTNNGGVWKCQTCGATWESGFQLDIHHKDQDSSNNDFSNLTCLCSQCHTELHAKWYKQIIPAMVKDAINSGRLDWRNGYAIN